MGSSCRGLVVFNDETSHFVLKSVHKWEVIVKNKAAALHCVLQLVQNIESSCHVSKILHIIIPGASNTKRHP